MLIHPIDMKASQCIIRFSLRIFQSVFLDSVQLSGLIYSILVQLFRMLVAHPGNVSHDALRIPRIIRTGSHTEDKRIFAVYDSHIHDLPFIETTVVCDLHIFTEIIRKNPHLLMIAEDA